MTCSKKHGVNHENQHTNNMAAVPSRHRVAGEDAAERDTERTSRAVLLHAGTDGAGTGRVWVSDTTQRNGDGGIDGK